MIPIISLIERQLVTANLNGNGNRRAQKHIFDNIYQYNTIYIYRKGNILCPIAYNWSTML